MTTARTPLVILGRTIGEYEGWDGDGGQCAVYYQFEPNEAGMVLLNTTYPDLSVDLNDGKFAYYDENGVPVQEWDIISVMSRIPRDDGALLFGTIEEHAATPGGDPLLSAIAGAGLTVAFDLKPGAPREDVEKALAIARGDEPRRDIDGFDWPTHPDQTSPMTIGREQFENDDDIQSLMDRDRE